LRQKYGRGSEDDGHAALIDLLCEELGEQGEERAPNLPDAVFAALTSFATEDARRAYDGARRALSLAEQRVERLAQLDEDEGPRARMELFRIMHELDAGLLESGALSDLLMLGAQGHDTQRAVAPLHALMGRLTRVLMARESRPHAGGESVPHLTLRMRRLRTLLHLLDVELREGDERANELRAQRVEDVRTLSERVSRDTSSAMDRVVHAALVRGCDSLVRGEVFELSDVVLTAANHVITPEGFAALSEGSMLPEVQHCLAALADLVQTLHSPAPGRSERRVADAVQQLSRSLPPESAPRTEGLRATLSRLGRALGHVAGATSLADICREPRTLELLEVAIDELVQLTSGARRRLGTNSAEGPPTSGHGISTLALALERALSDDERVSLELALETLSDSLRVELAPPFALAVMRVLNPVLKKPQSSPHAEPLP
ncbi:MAG TPA: hypothetical protein VFZ61_15085, partial [Polyangiales bacterium]